MEYCRREHKVLQNVEIEKNEIIKRSRKIKGQFMILQNDSTLPLFRSTFVFWITVSVLVETKYKQKSLKRVLCFENVLLFWDDVSAHVHFFNSLKNFEE